MSVASLSGRPALTHKPGHVPAGGMWRCAEGGAGCIAAARTMRGACWTTGAVGSGERTWGFGGEGGSASW